MIYEIAGLRILIENQYEYTSKFCREYLSENQQSSADITAKITKAEFENEKTFSPEYSDGYIENICLYRKICLQLPCKNRMLLHASILEYNGNAYAFLGRSGAGKSTHTRLWLHYLKNCRVINGDKPILERVGSEFVAHSTPWRGKENWGEKGFAPLRGLCFVEQAKENTIRSLTQSETSLRLFHQVLMPTDEKNALAALELMDDLIKNIPAYLLCCDISEIAVKTSFEALTKEKYTFSQK